MRRFEKLSHALHTRLPFSVVEWSHSASLIFNTRKEYSRRDCQKLVTGLDAFNDDSEEEDFDDTPDKLADVLNDKRHKNIPVYLVPCRESRPVLRTNHLMYYFRHSFVVPDSVDELRIECFGQCERLKRVTFGPSSSLRWIGFGAFWECDSLTEIAIPDLVEEIPGNCFYRCTRLSRVTFGKSSSLQRIGIEAFRQSRLTEIHIPDSVEEICEKCFCECASLSRVTFGASSSLATLGDECFSGAGLTHMSLPVTVTSVGGGSFNECPLRDFVVDDTGAFSVAGCLLLSRDGRVCYSCIGIVREVCIPESVEEIYDKCFYKCISLYHVTFIGSSLKRIGVKAFERSCVEHLDIPSSAVEVCDESLDLYRGHLKRYISY